MGLTASELVQVKAIREKQSHLARICNTESARASLEAHAQTILERATQRDKCADRDAFLFGRVR